MKNAVKRLWLRFRLTLVRDALAAAYARRHDANLTIAAATDEIYRGETKQKDLLGQLAILARPAPMLRDTIRETR